MNMSCSCFFLNRGDWLTEKMLVWLLQRRPLEAFLRRGRSSHYSPSNKLGWSVNACWKKGKTRCGRSTRRPWHPNWQVGTRHCCLKHSVIMIRNIDASGSRLAVWELLCFTYRVTIIVEFSSWDLKKKTHHDQYCVVKIKNILVLKTTAHKSNTSTLFQSTDCTAWYHF